MKDLSIKQNVLKEIMDLMDAREGESLKKHPKFASPKPESESEPEVEGELELEPKEEGFSPEMPSEKSEGELSEEELQMLLEKLQDMQ